jgi:hypothetical protein
LSASSKLGGYALGLAAIFGVGVAVGSAIGPEPADDAPPVTVVEHPPVHDGPHS